MSHFNQTIDDVTFKAACKNKTAAQKKIYELFSTPVYNLVFRITHNQADSLDLSKFLPICHKTSLKICWVFGSEKFQLIQRLVL